MNNNIVPCFSSHYSMGKSVINLELPEKIKKGGPRSLFSIAQEHQLKEVFLVDTSITGFWEFYENCKKLEILPRFGLKMIACDDIDVKDENSLKNQHEIIIWLKNSEAYKDIIKISTLAAVQGFYYQARIDCKNLKKLWTDNLHLAIPFFDSFIYRNLMTFSSIIPDFGFTKPTLFIEKHDLPFNDSIEKGVREYGVRNDWPIQLVHSILYEKKNDFKSYCVFRTMHNRSLFASPNIDHFGTDDFCWETYKELAQLKD